MGDRGLKLSFKVQKEGKEAVANHQEMADSPSRRTTRHRTQPKKYGDYDLQSTPSKRTSRLYEESSDDEMDTGGGQQKPTALFAQDDVEGQDIFQFKSRHTKLDLQNKVKAVINNSPKVTDSPKTPIRTVLSQVLKNQVEATPKHVKDIIKKRILHEVESESESDFSGGSSSDFVPEGSDNESISSKSSSENASEESSDDDTVKPTAQTSKPYEKQQISKSQGSRIKQKDSDYIITPDNYFMMHSSKKIATSDHTLARLKNLNLQDNEVQDIEISNEHKTRILELNRSYHNLFDRWLYVLSENFNVILYGIGSKRHILHQFQSEKLGNFPCVVVNGFFPSLTVKSILESIVIDLLENTNIPSNISDVISLIDSQLRDYDMNLFLIVHNIDGAMLRNGKAQSMLASLSQLKNVHTIATIDHINAPLLWDHSKLSKFKFTWWDVTSFLPYLEETSFENSLMTHRSGALQLSSLMSVHQSLTTNAKGIFNIIIEYQLENQKQAHYQGLPFKDLYSKSREQFLVSSDLALRAQLTEFLDHKLVKMKRTLDGSENLIIPIENTLLQQFLEQQKS